MNDLLQIRSGQKTDLEQVMQILNEEILHSFAIYTDKPKSSDEMLAWWESMQNARFPFFVCVREFEPRGFSQPQERLSVSAKDQEVFGFIYADSFRKLSSYHTTAELSLYVAKKARQQGIGQLLLTTMLEKAPEYGLHSLVSVIDSENTASCDLHRKNGFVCRGTWPEIARKFGAWRQAELWQYLYPAAEQNQG